MRDADEIGKRVVRRLGDSVRIDDHARIGRDDQRVAVGRRGLQCFHRDQPTGAGLVFHHHRAADRLAPFLREDAGENVHSAAGRKSGQHLGRRLRLDRCRQARRSDQCENKHSDSDRFHGSPSCLRGSALQHLARVGELEAASIVRMIPWPAYTKDGCGPISSPWLPMKPESTWTRLVRNSGHRSPLPGSRGADAGRELVERERQLGDFHAER